MQLLLLYWLKKKMSILKESTGTLLWVENITFTVIWLIIYLTADMVLKPHHSLLCGPPVLREGKDIWEDQCIIKNN